LVLLAAAGAFLGFFSGFFMAAFVTGCFETFRAALVDIKSLV
jgi:hypothetical protein